MVKTKEQFVAAASLAHGQFYDYSRANYINHYTKVCIGCPDHGWFELMPTEHTSKGRGCSECKKVKRLEKRDLSWSNLLENLKSEFDGGYEYVRIERVDGKTKVCLVCKEHGEFSQTIDTRKAGDLCKFCWFDKLSKNSKSDAVEFVGKARLIHGDRYDYSLVLYVSSRVKVDIKCLVHGVFRQTPAAHLQGANCNLCIHKQDLSANNFACLAREVHGDKYDYSGSILPNQISLWR